MAEYPRLDFVKEKRLFSEKERGAIIKMIAQTCFYHFSDFMQEAKFLRDRKQIKDMRVRMRKWLSLPSDEIDKKLYKRIRKITYFWPIYYWKHYARKKESKSFSFDIGRMIMRNLRCFTSCFFVYIEPFF